MKRFLKLPVYVKLMVLTALSFGVRMVYLAWRYTDDLRHLDGGDFILYRVGGEHFLANFDFSNSLFLARPPLYSLLIAVVGVNQVAILVASGLVGALVVPLAYVLARQLGLQERWAVIAAGIVLIDPASIVYSATPGPEPLANFLMAAAVVLVLWGVLYAEGWQSALGIGLAAGLTLFLSSWARPAAYLLWVPLGVWLMVVRWRRWYVLAAFAGVTLVGVNLWSWHNGVQFGNATFSTVGPYTQVYCRAASVQRFATGAPINEVYTDLNVQIAQRSGWDELPLDEIDEGTRYRYYTSSPEVERAMREVSREVFLTYPQWYVATIPVGLARMYGWTNKLPSWTLAVELPWHALLYGSSALGMWYAFRRKQWRVFWCVGLVVAYYTAGTLSVSNACMDTRMRSMLTPFLGVSAVVAWQTLRERFTT